MTESDNSETMTLESSDRAETEPTPERATDDPDDDETADDADIISATMQRYLYRGAFVALALFGLFAATQFYLNASRTISVWVTPDYRPLFQAAFNLVVVIACGLGLTVLVERVR
jgi:hypothetical protein